MKNKDHIVESTKMVTAVEWLVENAEDFFGGLLAPSIIEQAKQMEKEQHKEMFDCGRQYQLTGEGTFTQVQEELYEN